MGRTDEKQGTVKIHNDCVVEELLSTGTALMSSAFTGSPVRKKCRPSRAVSTPVLGAKSNEKVTKSAWLDRPAIETVQARADLQGKCTKEMCSEVLTNEKTLSKKVNDLIHDSETCKLRKKELLHKKWTERVYEPILRNIVNLMESPAYTKLSVQKTRHYKDYLEHVNKKGHVYLDTFSHNEYYPLALQSTSLVAVTKGIQDPIHQQENARFEEERIMMQCLAGAKLSKDELRTVREILLPPLPLSRKDISSNDWLSVPLVTIESPVRIASRSQMKNSKNISQIDFEKWAAPRQTTVRGTNLRKVSSPSLVVRQSPSKPFLRTYSSESLRPATSQEKGTPKHPSNNEWMSMPIQNKSTQTVCVS